MNFMLSMLAAPARLSVTRAARLLFVICTLLLVVSAPAFPQANQGTIQGSVFDQSGGAIAGATITVIDLSRGVSRPLTTDSAGAYAAPNLTPGTYTVRGESAGFQSLEHSNILVEVGQTVRVDLVLPAGAQTQTVTVTSEAPAINTTDVTLGGTMSNQAVNELPMNGRDFKNFLNLRPGVAAVQGGGIDSWSANGTRGEDVGYMVDGLRVDEAYTGNSVTNSPVPSGDNATDLPFDAIQEMDTVQNPKAEYGWKPGAIVNVGLKSGTNDLHGTAFAFGRDTALDARNYFNASPKFTKAPIEFEQFGGSAGGRIKKDKLFWFGDFEGQTYNVAGTNSITSPSTVLLPGGNTAANTSNSLVNACLDLKATAKTIAPLSAQLAGLNPTTCAIAPASYVPGPSESLFPTNASGNTTLFLNLVSTSYSYNGIGKIDYHINDHNTVNFMYFNGVGQGNFTSANGTIGLPGSSNSPFMQEYGPTKVQLYEGAWNWTPSSTHVNELRVGYDRFLQPYYGIDFNVNPLAYGFNTGVTDSRIFGFPTVKFAGFAASFGGGQHKVIGPDGSLQFLDHFSIVHGNHTLKFGGEFIDNRAQSYQNSGGKGNFNFPTLEAFLQGLPSGSGNSILIGDPTRKLTNYNYALFAQDDWRVSRKVTVNLGMRWEYTSVLKDSNNLLGNFSPTVGLQQVGKQIDAPYHGDFKDFGPRVGIAWDVRGNGRTVVRTGATVMYEYLPIISLLATQQVLGLSQVPTGATLVVGGVKTPGPGNIAIANVAFSGSSLTTVQNNWQAQTPACIAAAETGGTPTCPTVIPTATLAVQCGDGIGTDPGPCTTMAIDPNYRNGYITTFTTGVQQAINNNLTLDVSYVGTYGGRLPGLLDINQAALGSGLTPAAIASGVPTGLNTAAEQASRPYAAKFPYLSFIDRLQNLDRSHYNALQVTLTQRNWHRFSFLAGYTYSHALDNASSQTFVTAPSDSTQPQNQYANSDFDMTHRFTFSSTYILPGKKSFGQLLEGWQVNAIATLQTPQPWGVQDLNSDFAANGEVSNLPPVYYGQFWNFAGNRSDFNNPVPTSGFPCWKGSSANSVMSSANCAITTRPTQCLNAASALGAATVTSLNANGCYIVGNSVIFPPALGSDGNSGRNSFRGPHFRNLDLSINKNWRFKERLTAQFRAEFFNILNHPNFFSLGAIGHAGSQFDYPNKPNFGCSCITPDAGTGNLVLGAGGARAIQLGLKLIF